MRKTLGIILLAAAVVATVACSANKVSENGESDALTSEVIEVETAYSATIREYNCDTVEEAIQKACNPVYDDEFLGFNPNPTDGFPGLYGDEILEITYFDDINSYYLFKVVRVLDYSEAENLNGFSDFYGDYGNTFYEINVIKNLLTGELCDYNIVVPYPFAIKLQEDDCIPYKTGDLVAGVLQKKQEDSDFVRCCNPCTLNLDILVVDNVEYGYIRYVNGYEFELIPEKSLPMTDAERKHVTFTTQNPVYYTRKFKLSDYIDFIRTDWTLRGLPYSGSNPPSSINCGEYTLKTDFIPEYECELRESGNVDAGESSSYEELLTKLQSLETLNFIEYRINGVYTPEEAYELTKNDSFLSSATLYKAELRQDYYNDTSFALIRVNIGCNGTAASQEISKPVYAVGQSIVSPLIRESEDLYTAIPELTFCKYSIDGVPLAYHLDNRNIRFEKEGLVNLDLPLSDDEKSVLTTTKNNPAVFTQKSCLYDLIRFFKDSWNENGFSNKDRRSFPEIERTVETEDFPILHRPHRRSARRSETNTLRPYRRCL